MQMKLVRDHIFCDQDEVLSWFRQVLLLLLLLFLQQYTRPAQWMTKLGQWATVGSRWGRVVGVAQLTRPAWGSQVIFEIFWNQLSSGVDWVQVIFEILWTSLAQELIRYRFMAKMHACMLARRGTHAHTTPWKRQLLEDVGLEAGICSQTFFEYPWTRSLKYWSMFVFREGSLL